MARKNSYITISTSPAAPPSLGSSKFQGLNTKWLEDLLSKRLSNYSTVLIAETDDPIRLDQARHFFLEHPRYSGAPFYLFDPWNGLQRYDRSIAGFTSTTNDQTGEGYGSDVYQEEDPSTDLITALRRMDRFLKGERTVFFLQWLDSHAEQLQDPRLLYALRAWAFDSALLTNGSTVILVTADTSKLIDEMTANLLAWKRAPLADPVEREHIIKRQADNCGVPSGESNTQLVMATAGLSLHQLESSLLEAWHYENKFSVTTLKELKAEIIKRSDLVEVQEPDPRGFGAVGGYGVVKSFIREKFIRVLTERDRAKHFGVPLPRGVLLFGPPGTGKTLFAKALSHEVNLPFIHFRTENLYSKWLGESGRRFAEAIRLAEQMSPALVFIDEIDRFGKRTGGGDGASQETRKVFSQLLDWLGSEERKSIIVGTTNVPEHLDEAFLREGRFDYKIPFLYPTLDARKEILRIHLGLTGSKTPLPWLFPRDVVRRMIDRVAEETEGFTGAELEQISLRARHNAFASGREGAVEEDLLQAAGSFGIDRVKREDQRRHYLRRAEEFTNDGAFLAELERER